MSAQRNETVLPSGAFATVRPLLGRDLLVANRFREELGQDITYTLMCLAITVDGKPLHYEQLLDMDMRDILALQRILSPYIAGAITFPGKEE
jgi:hypothetical protein